MASIQMIRAFLRMSLVVFVLCLLMLLYTDKGTDGYRLMVYSLTMLGIFTAVLVVMLKYKCRREEESGSE